MFFAVVLFALVLVAGTLHRTGLVGVFALSALSAVWLLVNKGVEHETLIELSTGHGITPLDAAGLAGLALVVAYIVRAALARGGTTGPTKATTGTTPTAPTRTSTRSPEPD